MEGSNMKTDNQPNTLEYHNVQVGDVVRFCMDDNTVSHTIAGISLCHKTEKSDLSTNPHWIVISRASTKPKTKHQFGEWEIWNGNGEPPTGLVQIHCGDQTRTDALDNDVRDDWNWCKGPSGPDIIAFRRVIEPVRGKVVLNGMSRGLGLEFFRSESILNAVNHRLTLPTIDGKLVTGKYTGPDGSVIKIEDLA